MFCSRPDNNRQAIAWLICSAVSEVVLFTPPLHANGLWTNFTKTKVARGTFSIEAVNNIESRMKRTQLAGILSAPLVTLTLILVNELVFLLFLHDTSLPLRLLDTWSNFPLGVVTAIFTPDPQVFLCYTGAFQASACYSSYLSWLVVTAGSLGAYLVIFFVVNLGQSARETAIRSLVYAVMIIVISAASDSFGLIREAGSVGPSTAIYAGIGLVLGFAASNSIVWLLSGKTFSGLRQGSAIVIGIVLPVVLTGFALADPVGFFNVSSTQRVDATAHMFCFVAGALVSLPIGLRSVSRLRPRPVNQAEAGLSVG